MRTIIKGINSQRKLTGEFKVPGDKSISHRAVMLGAIAKGTTEIDGFLPGDDCLSTIRCFQSMGVNITVQDAHVTVEGVGLHGLRPSETELDVGNSGTTLRLMTGLLAGQQFDSVLTGDASIQSRPMNRVLLPLRQMGAQIAGREKPSGGVTAPVAVQGSRLTGITYTLPVASAQVKSAILLASLYASGETVVIEPEATRDHTEIMLRGLGADIEKKDGQIISRPIDTLYARPITIPGDISSAAYLLAAAAVTPGASLVVKDVGINETRTGIITALTDMGADIRVCNQKEYCGESVADIHICYSPLKGITLSGSLIPRLIDEIPVLAAVALYAEGQTVIRDAAELKVKETDRIHTVASEFNKMGAHITETADGMVIEGGVKLHGTVTDSHHDHRMAMSLTVAALGAEGDTEILNSECVAISFPGFFDYFI